MSCIWLYRTLEGAKIESTIRIPKNNKDVTAINTEYRKNYLLRNYFLLTFYQSIGR
jgi:hypothetical protein